MIGSKEHIGKWQIKGLHYLNRNFVYLSCHGASLALQRGDFVSRE